MAVKNCAFHTSSAKAPRLTGGANGKEFVCQYRRCKRCGLSPWVWKIPWSRKWHPAPVLLLGKFHGQRSLAGYSPWGLRELDMTEHLSTRTGPHVDLLPAELSVADSRTGILGKQPSLR